MDKPVSLTNFELFCRTCASCYKDNQPIFHYEVTPIPLVDMLKECTSIQIKSTDILPKAVCGSCVNLIVSLYDFKAKCHLAEQQLLNIYSNLEEDSSKFNKDRSVKEISTKGETTLNITTKKSKKVEEEELNNILSQQILNNTQVYQNIGTRNNRKIKNLFRCDKCEKTFRVKYKFNLHVSTNHPELVFACTKCGKYFIKKKFFLKRRLERQKLCNICLQHSGLNGDLQKNTTEDKITKENTCKECGRSFYSKSSLKCHYRTHTGEKHFLCTVCGMPFALLYNLKVHMRIHTGEKPYTCTLCDRKFSNRYSLKFHSLTHTKERNYQCEICLKRFKTSSILGNHMVVTHQGIRKFECNICSKRFESRSKLKRHINSHTGEKLHSCKICGKTCNEISNLRVHYRVHGYRFDEVKQLREFELHFVQEQQ